MFISTRYNYNITFNITFLNWIFYLGLRGLVSRSNTITYSAVNIKTGETIKETVSGFHARVLQHEIDHLDGILYIDKMLESKEV